MITGETYDGGLEITRGGGGGTRPIKAKRVSVCLGKFLSGDKTFSWYAGADLDYQAGERRKAIEDTVGLDRLKELTQTMVGHSDQLTKNSIRQKLTVGRTE